MRFLRLPVTLPRLEPVHTYGRDDQASPFARGPNERRLRLAVDSAALPASDVLDLLLEFGRHDDIELTTTDARGYATVSVGPVDAAHDGAPVLIERPDGGRTHMAAWPASTWLRFAEMHDTELGGDPAATERRYLLAAGLDGVTDGLVLADATFVHNLGRRSNPLTAEQGAALIGLYLRSRDHGEVSIEEHLTDSASSGWQYFIAARTVLTAAWRWWGACVATGQTPGGTDAMAVAQALLDRFPRCLRARDEVMTRCLVPIDRSDQEAILYHLDALLLMASGIFDATALVANSTYAIGTVPWEVGWRRPRWRAALARAAPELFDLTEPLTPTRAVIDLVAESRNTIHGEPLRGVRLQASGADKHVVQLPDGTATRITPALELLGGHEVWGFSRPGDSPTLLDPLPFVQLLIHFMAAALNAILDATEVERLPGVDVSKLRRGPAPALPGRDDFFSPAYTRRIALLMGLAT